MVKIIELIQRKNSLSAAECTRHMLCEFAPRAKDFPVIKGFNVAEAFPVPARPDVVQLGLPDDLGGFAETWVDSVQDYQQAAAEPPMRGWLAERAAFAEAIRAFVVTEDVILPVPASGADTRNNAFLTRAAGKTAQQFRAEWHGEHGAMARGIPYLRGFVLCDIIGEFPPVGVAALGGPEVEGVAQAYFANPEDEGLMIATPQAREWFRHGAETFGLIKAFAAHQTVIVPPAG